MTKNDIIRMGHEANLPSCHLTHPKALARFAALVAAAEREGQDVYGEEHMNPPDIKGYAKVKGIGLVAVLSEDIGGMTYVATWVKTEALIDRTEYLIDELPNETC